MFLQLFLAVVIIILIIVVYYYMQISYGVGSRPVNDGILIVWNPFNSSGEYLLRIGRESGKYQEYKVKDTQYLIKDKSLCPKYFIRIDDSPEYKIEYNFLPKPQNIRIES